MVVVDGKEWRSGGGGGRWETRLVSAHDQEGQYRSKKLY